MLSLALTFVRRFIAYGVWYLPGLVMIYPLVFVAVRKFRPVPFTIWSFSVPCLITWVVSVTPEFLFGQALTDWVPFPSLLLPATVSFLAVLAWGYITAGKGDKSAK